MRVILYLFCCVCMLSCGSKSAKPAEEIAEYPYFVNAEKPSSVAVEYTDKGYSLNANTYEGEIYYDLSLGSNLENKTISFSHKEDKITSLKVSYLFFVDDKGVDFIKESLRPYIKEGGSDFSEWIDCNIGSNKVDTLFNVEIRLNSSDRNYVLNLRPIQ